MRSSDQEGATPTDVSAHVSPDRLRRPLLIVADAPICPPHSPTRMGR